MREMGGRGETWVLCLQTQLLPTQVMPTFPDYKVLKGLSWVQATFVFVLFSLLNSGQTHSRCSDSCLSTKEAGAPPPRESASCGFLSWATCSLRGDPMHPNFQAPFVMYGQIPFSSWLPFITCWVRRLLEKGRWLPREVGARICDFKNLLFTLRKALVPRLLSCSPSYMV